MTTPTLAAEAFSLGWHEGALGAGADTAREAVTLHPELAGDTLDAYLNGVDDGRRGDRFRLDHPGADVTALDPCLCGELKRPGEPCPDPDCPTRPRCSWTSPSECAMARERAVAGTSDLIPSCPEHDLEVGS